MMGGNDLCKKSNIIQLKKIKIFLERLLFETELLIIGCFLNLTLFDVLSNWTIILRFIHIVSNGDCSS